MRVSKRKLLFSLFCVFIIATVASGQRPTRRRGAVSTGRRLTNPRRTAPTVQRQSSQRTQANKNVRIDESDAVQCANLVYAGSKTSKCFSDKFLVTAKMETNIIAARRFNQVRLSGDDLFNYPFSIMTGEGHFSLLEQERINLRSYLERGGFLLASAGCSSQPWNKSFRSEIRKVFPDLKLIKVPMTHKIFSTVFDIKSLKLRKSKGNAAIEALELNGKIVLVYSPDGLNDTSNAEKGCCCCGGNEIKNSQEVNVNVFTYSITH